MTSYPEEGDKQKIANMKKLLVLTVALLLAVAVCGEEQMTRVGSKAEWVPARSILVHRPGLEEWFGVIHPAAALFERVFDVDTAAAQHTAFTAALTQYSQDSSAKIYNLVDVLLSGAYDAATHQTIQGAALEELREFATQFLVYDSAAEDTASQAEYHRSVIAKLGALDLLKIIFLQPTVHLTNTGRFNTGFTATYELHPLMNTLFMRDHILTTAKGVVLCNLNSEQRKVESRVIGFALKKLGITPLWTVNGTGRVEGGDFLTAGDTALLGQGLRTNEEAVRQLLKHHVFGTKRVAIVKDSWKDQEQMHLDTYFNIISPKLAVMAANRFKASCSAEEDDEMEKIHLLKVDVYEMEDEKDETKEYVKVKSDVDFEEFMEETVGMKIIPVTIDDQHRYGINFLTLKENVFVGVDGVSAVYKKTLADLGVQAHWVNISDVTGAYGAAHCSTQVLERY